MRCMCSALQTDKNLLKAKLSKWEASSPSIRFSSKLTQLTATTARRGFLRLPTEHSVARCALPRISSNLRFRIASLPHCFEHNFQSDRRKPRQQRSPPPQPNRTLPAPGQLDNGKHGKTWQSQALHRVAFFDPPYGAKLGQKTCFFFKRPFGGQISNNAPQNSTIQKAPLFLC